MVCLNDLLLPDNFLLLYRSSSAPIVREFAESHGLDVAEHVCMDLDLHDFFVLVCSEIEASYFDKGLSLRIDKGSWRGALHLGTFNFNFGSCICILYIL